MLFSTWTLPAFEHDVWTDPAYRLFVRVQPSHRPPGLVLSGSNDQRAGQIAAGWAAFARDRGYDFSGGWGLFLQSYGAELYGHALDAVPGQSSSIFRASGLASAVSTFEATWAAIKSALDAQSLPHPSHLWWDNEHPLGLWWNNGNDGKPTHYTAWLADPRAGTETFHDGRTLADHDDDAPARNDARDLQHADNAAFADYLRAVVDEVTSHDLNAAIWSTFGDVFGQSAGGSNYANRYRGGYSFGLPSSGWSVYPKVQKQAADSLRQATGPAPGRPAWIEPDSGVYARDMAAAVSGYGGDLRATGTDGDLWAEAPGYDWSAEEAGDYLTATAAGLAGPLRIAAASGRMSRVLFWNYAQAFTPATYTTLQTLIRQAG